MSSPICWESCSLHGLKHFCVLWDSEIIPSVGYTPMCVSILAAFPTGLAGSALCISWLQIQLLLYNSKPCEILAYFPVLCRSVSIPLKSSVPTLCHAWDIFNSYHCKNRNPWLQCSCPFSDPHGFSLCLLLWLPL